MIVSSNNISLSISDHCVSRRIQDILVICQKNKIAFKLMKRNLTIFSSETGTYELRLKKIKKVSKDKLENNWPLFSRCTFCDLRTYSHYSYITRCFTGPFPYPLESEPTLRKAHKSPFDKKKTSRLSSRIYIHFADKSKNIKFKAKSC